MCRDFLVEDLHWPFKLLVFRLGCGKTDWLILERRHALQVKAISISFVLALRHSCKTSSLLLLQKQLLRLLFLPVDEGLGRRCLLLSIGDGLVCVQLLLHDFTHGEKLASCCSFFGLFVRLIGDDQCIQLLVRLDAEKLVLFPLGNLEQFLDLLLLAHVRLLLLLLQLLFFKALLFNHLLLFFKLGEPLAILLMQLAILFRVDGDHEH